MSGGVPDFRSKLRRLIPAVFPNRADLHSSARMVLGLLLNIIMAWNTLRPRPYGGGSFGAILTGAVPILAVLFVLPVFIYGAGAQRFIAVGLLVGPVILLGACVLEAILG